MKLIFFAALVFLLSVGCQSRAADAPVFPPPPRLATTLQELAAIKAKPDFAAVREAATKTADALLDKPLVLPQQGYGEWIFYYACPDDGTTLRMLSLDKHECPQCKKVYSDARTVAAYRAQQHYDAENASVTLGWAYAYSGDERYAAEVKRILLLLARDYPNYPERLDRWGNRGKMARLGGRRYVQSLDEAVGIIRLAKGYDLTRTAAAWSEADKQLVEKNLFGLTAATLLEFNQGINNHQTWYNAGLMAIASVLADAGLVEKVLTMEGGFHDQLKRSIGSDGLWYEGTMAYHNYALQAMFEIVDAGRRMGLPLQNEPKFRAMIEGPLRAAYPNGQFPVINDSDPGSFQQFSGAFEWAWNVYHEPKFAQAASWGNPQKLAAMLGPDAKPTWPLSTKSENLADAGLAILRLGEGPGAVCTFLDYGLHGGGHGHFDKLNLMLYANGREWLLDPGRLTYSHKEYKTWVKETAAHNTVTLGGQSQRPATGKLLFLQTGQNFTACAAESDVAYPDTTLRRSLLLTKSMLVDVFDVQSKEKAQIDWFAHAIVPALRPVEDRGQGKPQAPGIGSGYQHLRDATMWNVTGDSRWDFVQDTNDPAAPRLRLWLAGNGPEEVFVSAGIGYQITQKAPTLIRRRNASATRFITVYDLSGKGEYVQKVEVLPGAAPRFNIAATDGQWQIAFTDKEAQCSLVAKADRPLR